MEIQTEPEIVTLDNGDEIHVSFPYYWSTGRQYVFLRSLFESYVRMDDLNIRVRIGVPR